MYNRIVVVGNLTRDCELKYLPNGGAVCTTGIATNRRFKKQDGSQGEEVCFIDVSFFGRTGEIANQYTQKGSKVLIEGRLKLDSWTDQQGVKRSKHSIVAETLQMLDGRANNEPQGVEYEVQDAQGNIKERGTMQTQKTDIPEIDINQEEIPF